MYKRISHWSVNVTERTPRLLKPRLRNQVVKDSDLIQVADVIDVA